MRQALRKSGIWVLGLWLMFGLVSAIDAQEKYPFRDTSLSDSARIQDLLGRLTLDEKVQLMSDHPKIPRLGIVFSGQVEGLHGLALGGPGGWGGRGRQPVPTTTFPQEKGLGATWDPELLKKIGSLEGSEARYYYQNPVFDRGGLVVRAPNADLSRDPRWGRTEESMGEDPYLVGTMTVAFAQGLQGPDPKHWQAASLMKHFLANENEDGRTHTSSDFDDRLFREYYSVPFRMGFEEGGSRAVMTAYNAWNGIPMTIHPVLKDVMIKEWGNDGIICTDGGALGLLITSHKRFPDKEQGSAAAVKAGINHFLDTYKPDLTKALKDDLLTEADMDAALRNLLTVYLKLGEMDPPGVDPYAKIGVETAGALPPWERESSRELARHATDESIVLLKNENSTLPLDKAKLKTVAVIGPWIDQVLQDWYSGTWPYSVTILDGIREAAGKNVKVAVCGWLGSGRGRFAGEEGRRSDRGGWQSSGVQRRMGSVPDPVQWKRRRRSQNNRAGAGRTGEESLRRKSEDDRGTALELSVCNCLEPAECAGDRAHHAQQPGGRTRACRCPVWRLLAGGTAHPDVAHRRCSATADSGLQPAQRAYVSLQQREAAVSVWVWAELYNV